MAAEGKGKKMMKSAVFFIALVIVVFAVILWLGDPKRLLAAVKNADPVYLIIGIGCICCFICCESINIGRVLKALGYKVGFMQKLKYGAAGFFFSGITPSASGGQPMQLYYMSRDKINLSHGTISLIVELMGFQIVTISIALFGLIYERGYISTLKTVVRVLIYVGISVSTLILILIIVLLLSRRIAAHAETLLKLIFLKLKKDKYIAKITEQMDEYRIGTRYIVRQPKLLIKNILTAFIQMSAMYSITYLVYLALGGSGCGWLQIFLLQAVLTAGIMVIPLPGGTGAGEGGFSLVFSSVFTGGMMMPGIVLARGLSFYFGLVITGAFLLVIWLRARAAAKRRNGAAGHQDSRSDGERGDTTEDHNNAVHEGDIK